MTQPMMEQLKMRRVSVGVLQVPMSRLEPVDPVQHHSASMVLIHQEMYSVAKISPLGDIFMLFFSVSTEAVPLLGSH